MSQTIFHFELMLASQVTARALVMSRLGITRQDQMAISKLIDAGALFDIEAAAIRVAVTRLIKEGLLCGTERGIYTAGPAAKTLTEQVRGWQNVIRRTKPWSGNWIGVLVGHLPRANRKRLRARIRALQMFGLAEVNTGLWLRPDNLVDPMSRTRDKLVDIGLDKDALVVQIADQAPEQVASWKSLWATDKLQDSYRAAIATLEKSTLAVTSMSVADAAREMFLVGQSVLRTINKDPLLPNDIIDNELFTKMVASMVDYTTLGRVCWDNYYLSLDKHASWHWP